MDDEPEEIGIPEWVVTFGDMMSLLLTFFIMLVSLSEIKEEEQYQAMTDSIQESFGYPRRLETAKIRVCDPVDNRTSQEKGHCQGRRP